MTVKQEILQRLLHSPAAYHSGEALAKELNVSRGAVWKAVKALKAEGYPITGVNNRGYTLQTIPEPLKQEDIKRAIAVLGQQVDVLCFDTLDSTNLEARRRAHRLKRPLLVLAEGQTMGRGRFSRTFYAPAHAGLYMSLAVPVCLPLETAALITQGTAVVTARALEACGSEPILIKWVNDLFLHGKKVCGILTEAISNMETGNAAYLIIGIGINLVTRQFPDEISAIAGCAGALDRTALCARITSGLLALIASLPATSFLEEYRARCFVLGKEVSYQLNGERYDAVATDIDASGRLVTALPNGDAMVLSSGEVSVKIKATKK